MFPGIHTGTYKTPPSTRKPLMSVADAWKKALGGKLPYAPSKAKERCGVPNNVGKILRKSPHANL